jgi:hypothetical protein
MVMHLSCFEHPMYGYACRIASEPSDDAVHGRCCSNVFYDCVVWVEALLSLAPLACDCKGSLCYGTLSVCSI